MVLLVAVVAAALEAQVDGRHAGVHRPRGALPPGIRRQGQSRALAFATTLVSALPRTVGRYTPGPYATTLVSALSIGAHSKKK